MTISWVVPIQTLSHGSQFAGYREVAPALPCEASDLVPYVGRGPATHYWGSVRVRILSSDEAYPRVEGPPYAIWKGRPVPRAPVREGPKP